VESFGVTINLCLCYFKLIKSDYNTCTKVIILKRIVIIEVLKKVTSFTHISLFRNLRIGVGMNGEEMS